MTKDEAKKLNRLLGQAKKATDALLDAVTESNAVTEREHSLVLAVVNILDNKLTGWLSDEARARMERIRARLT